MGSNCIMVAWQIALAVYCVIALRMFYVLTVGVSIVLRDKQRSWKFQLLVVVLGGVFWPVMFRRPSEALTLLFASRITIRNSLELLYLRGKK